MAVTTYFRTGARAGIIACAVLIPTLASAQSADPRLDPQSAAGLSLRITTLEEQVRQLNGQIEALNFQIRQLQGQPGQVGQSGAGRSGTAVAQPQRQQLPPPQGNIVGASGQPQTLGQVPGQPLDLSSALGQPLPEQQGQQAGGGQLGIGQPSQPQQQLVLAPSGDPKDAYDLSYGYILRGEFDVAEASFRQFLAQFPNDPLAGNAQYWLGESLFARGLYRDAADAFLQGFSNYPDGAKAPESLYKLGLSLKELGQAEAACSTFAEIPQRYPRAAQAVLERARSEMQKSGC